MPTTRDTDVFCVTPPKCGQTWVMTLMHHLRTGAEDPDFRAGGIYTVMPWLEMPIDMTRPDIPAYDVPTRLAELEALDDPRVFKMHVTYDEIPRPPGSKARIVTITRHPLDVPYSMYRHLRALRGDAFPTVPDSFDDYVDRWLEIGNYFHIVGSLWPHREDPDLLWLTFEGLHADPGGEARRLVSFLGWDVAESVIDRAVELASFAGMRRAEKNILFAGGTDRIWAPDQHFVREGAIGKNRQRLGERQAAKVLARVHASFEPECAEFVLAH